MSNVLLKSKIKKFLFLGLILISLFFIFLSKKEKSISPKLASLSQNSFQETFVDPNKKSQPELPEFILVQNNSFQSNLPPYIITPRVFAQIVSGSEIKNEIRKHIVEKGESLWSIAKKYDLKIETIIWANDLESATIYPGQELTILPVDGLIHIVKKGDTLEAIAKKYEVDPEKIALINGLYSPDEIFENQALIVPGGEISFTSQIETASFTNLSTNNFYGKSHAYPYGYCTWWVAQKRAIPSWGHAKDSVSYTHLTLPTICSV